MKIKKTVCVAAVSALFAMFSAIGNATVITSGTNNPLSFSWSKSTIDGNLTGTGSLTVSGFNSSSLNINVTLTNTSLDSADRLTAFGFGINPNATGVSFTDASDAGMINASMSFIPGLAAIEVCAFGGPNCQGGGSGGILGGANDAFSLLLAGTWGNSVDIAPIGFKYQTDGTSYEFTTSSSSGGSSGTSGQSIPEPGVLALMGIGLVGQALLMRQRRRRLQN